MDIWKMYEVHAQSFDKYYSEINSKNYVKILNKLYNFIKNIDVNYYKNGEILKEYYFLKTQLILVEKKIQDLKELNTHVRFGDMDKDNIIEYIIFKTRKIILKSKYLYTDDIVTDEKILNNINMSNDCYMCAQYIKKQCDNLNIKSYILPIYPGYNKDAMLYDGNGFHFANIIKNNSKYYLVDVTYSQFFYSDRCNLNRLGIMETGGCNAGVFMLMTDKGKNIAKNIIKNGYIELTEEVLKTYLDSFTISFRNGLYYENTNDFSYTTSYTVDDYIKFLKGEDNQLNYENKKILGYQNRPLKNKNLCFKKI